jgi:outer membrane protein assembly factor BamB
VRTADLDQDGTPEIIVGTQAGLVIYGKAASGNGFLQRTSAGTSAVLDLQVADLDGDNVPEIYTLETENFASHSTLKRYDTQLQLVHSTALTVQANSLYVEDSAFARKNLLIGSTQGTYPTVVTNAIRAIDAQSGVEVWRSPALPGTINLNSLQYVDVNGDGKKEISFATSNGMFYTR